MSTTTPLHLLSRRTEPRRAVLAAVLALVAALSGAFAMAPDANAAAKKYNICVKTGWVKNAGTDSDVKVIIGGVAAQPTSLITLDDGNDNFETGQRDCFSVKSNDVGRVTSVTVWTNGNRNWYLEYIEVNGTKAALNDWVHSGYTHIWAGAKLYKVCVTTGTVSGAGTDSDVEVNIGGVAADPTGFIALANNADPFENGQTDCFRVWGADVGRVTSVTVWTNGNRNWYLADIEVNDDKDATFNNWVPRGSTHIWVT